MKKVFKWKDRSRKAGEAKIVGKALEEIRLQEKGKLIPSSVVNAAKKRTSVLHKYFDWDDALAAQKHRETQARDLIRSVCVIYVEEKSKKYSEPVRAYVHIQTEETNSYLDVATVLSDEELRNQMFEQGNREILSWKRKYELLKDVYKDVFKEIDKIPAKRLRITRKQKTESNELVPIGV